MPTLPIYGLKFCAPTKQVIVSIKPLTLALVSIKISNFSTWIQSLDFGFACWRTNAARQCCPAGRGNNGSSLQAPCHPQTFRVCAARHAEPAVQCQHPWSSCSVRMAYQIVSHFVLNAFCLALILAQSCPLPSLPLVSFILPFYTTCIDLSWNACALNVHELMRIWMASIDACYSNPTLEAACSIMDLQNKHLHDQTKVVDVL